MTKSQEKMLRYKIGVLCIAVAGKCRPGDLERCTKDVIDYVEALMADAADDAHDDLLNAVRS